MRKLRNLTGIPVICKRQKIGRVIQAQLSDDLRALEGVWVDCALRGTRYIAAEHIGTIGEVALMADHRGTRRRMTAKSLVFRAVGTDGQRLGAIVGAEIDEVSLMVCALELSKGFWDDLYNGRSVVTCFRVNEAECETVIVDSEIGEKEVDAF